MLDKSRSVALGAIVLAAVCAASPLSAQVRSADVQTDARWHSWLGCWAADSVETGSAPSMTCFVPVANGRGVDALTIARGAVVNRDRLDATGRPLAIDGNGCKGTQTVNFSANGRRIYVHADYTCGGAPGTSTAIYALSQAGEWLRVEKVRAGGGAIVTVAAMRPAPLSPMVAAEAARSIEMRQRLVTTARASAAAPITVEEIVDAVHNLDGDVVYAWLDASEQTFDFNATQLTALANAGAPAPLMQLVTGEEVQQIAPQAATVNVGPVTTIETKPEMATLRTCPPGGCLRENRYSTYNGYEYNLSYGYPYPGAYPYPYAVYPYVRYAPYVYYTTPRVGGVRRGPAVRPRPYTPPARPVKPRVTPIAPRRR